METISGVSSMLETSRDLTLDAVQQAAARTFGGSAGRDLTVDQIKKLLNSKFDQEILDGLRKVVSMIYRGQDCLSFFSTIIKNVASPNVEIKKLVYIYLLQYAEQEPDLALLSINTIQKSLSDQNPQVRAMALRVMSGIRVPLISQIVSLAIKKACGDMSATVRKAAALAIPKCYRLEPNTEPQLIEYITQLLGDKQYYVVGPAVTAFLEICPDRIDLIHKSYRGLVKKLVDMDEWGQLALIRMLTIYARRCFPRHQTGQSDENTSDEDIKEREEIKATDQTLDPDLVSFLNTCRNLLQNRNPAVIVAVTRAFLHLGTAEYLLSAVRPLIALLRGPADQHEIVLYDLVSICMDHPASFAQYVDHFWIRSTDSRQVWRLKMEILTLVFPRCDSSIKGLILNELEHFTTSANLEMISESVRAIGRCAQNDASTREWCMNLLLKQASSPDDKLVGEVLTVIRHLIQQSPEKHRRTIIRLAKNLDSIYNAQARATIIWLVGEYATTAAESESIAPDVFRILCKSFAEEERPVKSQIVRLGAKLYLQYLNNIASAEESKESAEPSQESTAGENEPDEGRSVEMQNEEEQSQVALLWDYVLLLVRYDQSYELRDQTRLYRNLLADRATLQLANLVLSAPKPVPQVPSPSKTRKGLLIGSATLVVGQEAGPMGLVGYEPLPDWVKPGEEPDPSLRNVGAPIDQNSAKIPAAAMLDSALDEREPQVISPRPKAAPKVAQKSLDDWLDEEDPPVDNMAREIAIQRLRAQHEEEETDEEDEESEDASEEEEEESEEGSDEDESSEE